MFHILRRKCREAFRTYLIISLFPLYVLAEPPNDVIAEAANLLDQELKARKEELTNDKRGSIGRHR